MVALSLCIILCVINTFVYYMIDMYFNYAEAMHTHTYKSKAYTVEKKLAVKKISNQGYKGL